jgi:hypothetical protein
MCKRDHKPSFGSIPFWLLIAAFSLALTPWNVSAVAATPFFLAPITTVDGKTYDKVTLEKVEPDGLLISFVPAPGGSGTAKVKFRDLPKEMQNRFSYDPARASEYEIARAQGEAAWRTENAAWEEKRQAAQAERADRERQLLANVEERAAAEAEQARADAANNAQQAPPYYYYPGYFWPDTFNSFPRDQGQGFRHNQNQPVGVAPSPISPNVGPMRPTGR